MKMIKNVNGKSKNEVLKNTSILNTAKFQPLVLDRLSAVLVMSKQQRLLHNNVEVRLETSLKLKAKLEKCDIKPAGIEMFNNRVYVSWIPRDLVLCETSEQFNEICNEFANYLKTIEGVNLIISPGMISKDSNYYESEVYEDIDYAEPTFSKENFNFSKPILVLEANYDI